MTLSEMALADVRERLAACPIPEDARSVTDDNRHRLTGSFPPHAEDDYWWVGPVFEYAFAYRRDVQFLLAEIERLSAKKPE